jgi:hypothetical protein
MTVRGSITADRRTVEHGQLRAVHEATLPVAFER